VCGLTMHLEADEGVWFQTDKRHMRQDIGDTNVTDLDEHILRIGVPAEGRAADAAGARGARL
jgi:hypothetical protein